MDESRLEALETKAAYQDRTIAELNALVAEQSLAIGRLEKQVKAMAARLKDLGSDKLPSGERPPHY
jgi:uncharacterized coiled-coil protein SlyX